VIVQLLQSAAAVYLAAALIAGIGMALETRRLERASVVLLGSAVLIQSVSFLSLHRAEIPPPLTDLSWAFSFMTWIGALFYLFLLRRSRLQRLVVLVAPGAFLGAFVAAMHTPGNAAVVSTATGSWPHTHVLLASAGLALLALAGLAGMIFLIEHSRLKSKRRIDRRLPLPSLEALDRVNAVTLSIGFLLLTLGVISGMFWLQAANGKLWTGTVHETWSLVAWAIYAVLVSARFVAKQGSRRAAVSAVAGFAFLFFAVIGLGLVS
jgi:ABC-type transport system involved in cytochrome c biogenesis permease subunit